jgi:hypothetical protein
LNSYISRGCYPSRTARGFDSRYFHGEQTMTLRFIGYAQNPADKWVHFGDEIRAKYEDKREVSLCGKDMDGMFLSTVQTDKICWPCRSAEKEYEEKEKYFKEGKTMVVSDPGKVVQEQSSAGSIPVPSATIDAGIEDFDDEFDDEDFNVDWAALAQYF